MQLIAILSRIGVISKHLIRYGVSIHAPARGATAVGNAVSRIPQRFNPRTRTGCDIQLHFRMLLTACFNPRTRTGCDTTLSRAATRAVLFQSTHPHGVRRIAEDMAAMRTACFNPRTRTGCDRCFSAGLQRTTCFNPRTRTGCDTKLKLIRYIAKVSIHAPARGATWPVRVALKYCLFQSTHPHGVRQNLLCP